MGTGNKAEMLIAVCAVLTSVIALFVAWDQGRVMRAQQHGMVYPVLQAEGFVSASTEMREMGIRFRNSGVGPALIEAVEIFENGTKLESLFARRDALPGGYDLSWTSMIGRAVAPGDEVVALDLYWPTDTLSAAEQARVAADWGNLSMKVCYCSVFGRCWVAHGLADNSPAERVKACKRSETDIFADLSVVDQALEQTTQEAE